MTLLSFEINPFTFYIARIILRFTISTVSYLSSEKNSNFYEYRTIHDNEQVRGPYKHVGLNKVP